MNTKTCEDCKTEIEVKNRYEEGKGRNGLYNPPCDTCQHRENEENEWPCNFCSYSALNATPHKGSHTPPYGRPLRPYTTEGETP